MPLFEANPSADKMSSDHAIIPSGTQEAARLATLHRYGILDTPEEPVFDDLTRLAAEVCETPIAVISFVDEDRQWFKSRHGTQTRQHPRHYAFCAQVVADEAMLVVSHPEEDPRFAPNDLIIGQEQARFYAGAPLRAPNGHVLGALAVMDCRPRTLKPGQQESLHALARQVIAQLELRLHIDELRGAAEDRAKAEAALRKSEERFHEFMNNSPALAFIKDEYGRYVYVNQKVLTSFQIPEGGWIGRTDAEIFAIPTAQTLEENDLSVLNDGITREIEEIVPTRDGKSQYWLSQKFLLRGSDGQRQIGGLAIDITGRKAAEQERERLMSELREAVTAVKTLKGLIPICASCKNIRDDEGYWKQIEFYLCEHSELEFTHGICPTCLERLYPDFVAAQRDGTLGQAER